MTEAIWREDEEKKRGRSSSDVGRDAKKTRDVILLRDAFVAEAILYLPVAAEYCMYKEAVATKLRNKREKMNLNANESFHFSFSRMNDSSYYDT